MARTIQFIKKEFLHILRDKRTMLILLGMPMVQIILFGFAISVEVRNINLVVVAQRPAESVREIVEKIDVNPYFTVLKMVTSSNEAIEMMRSGATDMILHLPADFDRRIAEGEPGVQMVVDASNPNTAVTEQMYLRTILTSYFTERYPNMAVGSNIEMDLRLCYNPRMESAYNFVPGIMGLIMIIICAMMTSVSIVREKEMGTMEVLLVSPVKPITIIIAKMVPYFVLSCVNLAVILLLSHYVLAVPISGSLFWIGLISVVYILLSLALGLLISTLVKTQMATMLCSAMLLMLPILMLSGMLFPIESAPLFFQWLSYIVPARWYISAMRKLMLEGVSLRYVAAELSILAGFTIMLVSVALLNFKNRIQ